MKNDTTFVRMRSGDHLGDAKSWSWSQKKGGGGGGGSWSQIKPITFGNELRTYDKL